MALKKNVIYIYFKGKHLVTSKSQYQYNHGQFLYFADLDLPQTFEVHFSNTDEGYAKPQIGSNRLVEIPDAYFWTKSSQIYAWIYLHEGTTDGETKYEVIINLERRSEPVYEEILPTQQTTIERAIAELNNAVDVTTENANKTGEDRTQVSNIKDEIVDLKEDIDANAELATEKAQEAVNASLRSEASAQNAAEYESNAHGYSDEAKDYAQQALESKTIASQKATIATDASVETLGYRDETLVAKNDVLNLKQDVIDYKNETKGYLDETKVVRADVQNIDNEVKDYASQAQASATGASQSATASANSASASAQSASEAQSASTNAETYALNSGNKAVESAQSAQASANSATQAQGYANDASASAQSASGYASSAQTSANTASSKASEASQSATTASTKASEASTSASQALSYKNDAESAKTASQTAQGLAEDARDDAQTAQTLAENAESNAESTVHGVLDSLSLVETSGSIVETHDAFPVSPEKMVVDIDPVQDLHGQESPYPAGGGKNKFNVFALESKDGLTVNSDGTLTTTKPVRSGKTLAQLAPNLIVGESYKLLVTSTGTGNLYIYLRDIPTTWNYGTSRTITQEMLDSEVNFYATTEGVSTTLSDIMIMDSSITDVSYMPYENICPISGWTQVDVEQRGKNVWDEEWEVGGIIASTGNNGIATDRIRTTGFISIKPNTTYYCSIPNGSMFAFFYDADKAFISPRREISRNTFTTPDDARFMRFHTYSYGNTYNHDISINYPSTDHDYHPYTGRSITIDLGQTVYGGKLNVLTGELTIDKAKLHKRVGDMNNTDAAPGWKSAGVRDIIGAGFNAQIVGAICSAFSSQFIRANTNGVNDILFLPASGIGKTQTELISSYPDLELDFVIPLATPITIQLTPQQITLLKDYNALWADTGNISEFAYRVGEFATKADIPEVPVKDVKVNGESVVQNEIANIDLTGIEDTIESLEEDHYKPYTTDTASGAIASFSDGADNIPLKSFVVDIDPVQDLHGQDAPYPAGGGKNLLPAEYTETITLTKTFNFSSPLPAGTYTLSFISSDSESVVTSYQVARWKDTSGANAYSSINPSTKSVKFTNDEPCSRIVIYSNKAYNESSGFTTVFTGLMLESGSKTDYAPYENICPISGWTQVGVNQSGANVFDESAFLDIGGVLQADGTYYISNIQPIYNKILYQNNGYNGQIAITFLRKTEVDKRSVRLIVMYTDGTSVKVGDTNATGAMDTYTFVTSDSKVVDKIMGDYGSNLPTYLDLEIAIGTTATPYEPYTGRSITIDLGQTVYGGHIDVLSGELVVDKGYLLKNTADMNNYEEYPGWNPSGVRELIGSGINGRVFGAFTNISSASAYAGSGGGSGGVGANTNGETGDTLMLFKEYFGKSQTEWQALALDVQFVIPLKNPITIQLTPHEVNSLLGINNIWADSGDTEVEYRADTKLYISKKIAEAIASITQNETNNVTG